MHVKKGDQIVVIAGKHKGKTGKILKAIPSEGRVIVEGLNRVTRHLKPSQKNPKGGTVSKEMPIQVSNVLHIDPKSNKPTRVGKKWVEGKGQTEGHWSRYAKGSGAELA